MSFGRPASAPALADTPHALTPLSDLARPTSAHLDLINKWIALRQTSRRCIYHLRPFALALSTSLSSPTPPPPPTSRPYVLVSTCPSIP